MSCGNNHKYDAYQKASDALKAALVEALNTDEETSTLTELFEHYIGARNRADKASRTSSIYGDSVITFGDGYSPIGAADTVDFDYSGLGTDTIYTSGLGSDIFNVGLGSSSVDTITFG